MINLPIWKLTLTAPLYDTSSLSPIEQTAQVYGKMRELVEAYNRFTEDLTKAINDHEQSVGEDISNFKNEITCIMNKYIASVDTEVRLVHEHLHELLKNYERDVEAQTRKIVDEALKNGTITLTEVYDDETESLNFVMGGIT